MIEHIVLFKWIEGTSETQIAEVVEALKGLKEKIPGIVDLSCGKNFSDRSQGYQTGLVVRFSDRNALAAYQPHPDHQAVVQNYIKPIAQEILCVDYSNQ
jgi:Stress responsive A/B Barrel Domain